MENVFIIGTKKKHFMYMKNKTSQHCHLHCCQTHHHITAFILLKCISSNLSEKLCCLRNTFSTLFVHPIWVFYICTYVSEICMLSIYQSISITYLSLTRERERKRAKTERGRDRFHATYSTSCQDNVSISHTAMVHASFFTFCSALSCLIFSTKNTNSHKKNAQVFV